MILKTLATYATHEEEIKRSRFLVHAERVETPAEAMVFFEKYSDPSARHNCWAYRVGQEYRFNDDGEPSGTAGKRIFAAIDQQGLDHVAVLVVRWFGGIKLGAGGLSRAYGGSASTCLRLAEWLEVKPKGVVTMQGSYEQTQQMYYLIERYNGVKQKEDFDNEGLEIEVLLECEQIEEFINEVRESSHGAIYTRQPKDK